MTVQKDIVVCIRKETRLRAISNMIRDNAIKKRRNKQPIDLIAAKGRKHLTKAEYEERKSGEISAPSDAVKTPLFLTKNTIKI